MSSTAMQMTKKMMAQQYRLQGTVGESGSFDPMKLRQANEASLQMLPPEPGVTFTEEKLGILDAELCTCGNVKEDAVIIYIHGGGLVAGNAATSRNYASILANATGYRVYSCSYRLAPEHIYPAAVEDCVSGYRACTQKYPDTPIFLVGESGGAYLSLVTALLAKEQGIRMPAAIAIYSVVADLTGTIDRSANAATDISLSESAMAHIADIYCPDKARRSEAAASPMNGDYKGLCPILLAWDDSEILAADSKLVEKLAREAGVEVHAKGYPDAFHAFPTLGHMLPESEEVLNDTIAFFHRFLKTEAADDGQYGQFENMDLIKDKMGSLMTAKLSRDGWDIPVAKELQVKIPGTGFEGSNAIIYYPEGEGPFDTIMYIHGGGMISGYNGMDTGICKQLVRDTGCAVISPNYVLAPKHKFPGALNELYAMIRYLRENEGSYNLNTKRMALGGNSAGGNYAAALCVMAAQKGDPPFTCAILTYPAMDLTPEATYQDGITDSEVLNPDCLELLCDLYLPDTALVRDPLVSPILADAECFPPVILLSGRKDALYFGGKAFVDKLNAANKTVSHVVLEDTPHGFIEIAGYERQGRFAKAMMCAFVNQYMGKVCMACDAEGNNPQEEVPEFSADGHFTAEWKITDLLNDPTAGPLVQEHLGELLSNPMMKQAKALSIGKLYDMMPMPNTKKKIRFVIEELAKL